MSYSYDRRNRTAALPAEIPVPRLERIVDGIEREAKQMRFSLDQYKKDTGKYQPQLGNLARSAAEVRTMGGVILRALGEKDF
jgi:hypothetical protein